MLTGLFCHDSTREVISGIAAFLELDVSDDVLDIVLHKSSLEYVDASHNIWIDCG